MRIVRDVFRSVKINTFNTKDFILGVSDPALNIIYTLLKWLIWKARFHNIELTVPYFHFELALRIKTDKLRMIDRHFETKWHSFKSVIE